MSDKPVKDRRQSLIEQLRQLEVACHDEYHFGHGVLRYVRRKRAAGRVS